MSMEPPNVSEMLGPYRLGEVHCADCLEMRQLPDGCVDAVVMDPPYGLGFMGKAWDSLPPGREVMAELLRVAKPGAHMLAFGGTRTFHRLACAIEDAGWEIRDTIMWVYGSGFPKSLDVSKAIDKAAGARREVVGQSDKQPAGFIRRGRTDPATDAAKQWQGWGTALKPAWEPIIVARKPLEGTVAANVQKWGTGAMNIDGCRIAAPGEVIEQSGEKVDMARGTCAAGYDRPNATMFRTGKPKERSGPAQPLGRWPANLIHDGSEEATAGFPWSGGQQAAVTGVEPSTPGTNVYGDWGRHSFPSRGDTGSAARFFACFPQDLTCILCGMPYDRHTERSAQCKTTNANDAARCSETTPAKTRVTALWSAERPQVERLALHARSAGNLCASCATAFALALVATRRSVFSREESEATLVCTGSSADSTLFLNLVFSAVNLESTGTIPTTGSLSRLFGYVLPAIVAYTSAGERAKAAGDNGRVAATRFLYSAKASKRERGEGNDHPTVKPLALMRYLCRLVTPPNGVVLDPFSGSGTTGVAALTEGFRFLGFEKDAHYAGDICAARIEAAEAKPPAEHRGGQGSLFGEGG